VVAFERTTLYGLTLNPRRRVHYGGIDARHAREIFIRAALVAGEYDSRAPFFLHNRRLLSEIRELEHKSRRQDVLVDEDRMFAFFDARIPPDVVNGQGFEHWRREAERENPRLLFMSREDLMRHGAEAVTPDLFPERLEVGGVPCRLAYRFEPGHPLDGVTLTVPLALLNRLDEAACEWLVPGMVRDKVAALVKALPKKVRHALTPLPEFVTGFLCSVSDTPARPGLRAALAAYVRQKTGLAVTEDDLAAANLPPHLTMNVRVVDEEGHELACDRDLAALKKRLGEAARLTFAQSTVSPGAGKS
jgi:ATP-dependent helicase HrpA